MNSASNVIDISIARARRARRESMLGFLPLSQRSNAALAAEPSNEDNVVMMPFDRMVMAR